MHHHKINQCKELDNNNNNSNKQNYNNKYNLDYENLNEDNNMSPSLFPIC